MTDEPENPIEIEDLDPAIIKLVTDNFHELLQDSTPVENLEKKN